MDKFRVFHLVFGSGQKWTVPYLPLRSSIICGNNAQFLLFWAIHFHRLSQFFGSSTLTRDHSLGQVQQWITLYKVVRNTENEMINFQLNQSKPFISLLTFGNADHKNGLTSFRIQCRIFLCWGKSGTGILVPASAVLLRSQVFKSFAFSSQRRSVDPVSATDEKCLTANRSKREDQEVQALA